MATGVSVPLPPPSVDFNFDSSNCSSPSISAPSSPNLFFSAPTSPTRASSFLHQLHTHCSTHCSASSAPPHAQHHDNVGNEDLDFDFEFDFSGHLERSSLSADELFDGGKIRPLKPPSPPLRLQSGDGIDSPRRSRISQGKKIVVQEASSPRHHQKRDFDFDFDRFASALEESRKGDDEEERKQQKRGRSGRASSLSFPSANSGRKGSRSMSPLRVSDMDDVVSEDFSQTAKAGVSSSTSNPKSSSYYSSFLSFTKKGYRKWRLKDFLLFRSASEGRATAKDPLRKYAVLSKKAAAAVEEEARNCSFRSTESSGSVSRRKGPVSAHELHYTVNRAASEEMKKKTVLPYKQLGPLGCLGFNPTFHDITRGIGSLTR